MRSLRLSAIMVMLKGMTLAALLGAGSAVPTRRRIGGIVVDLDDGAGHLVVGTRGPSAFAVSFLKQDEVLESRVETPMVQPDRPDAPLTSTSVPGLTTVKSSFGSVTVTSKGVITLFDGEGKEITRTDPVIVRHKGKFSFSASKTAKFYGRGAGREDATTLPVVGQNTPLVENRRTNVPYFFTTDGYSALGAVDVTTGNKKFNVLPAAYEVTQDGFLVWTTTGHFDLYLMLAKTVDEATKAYYSLIGAPRVPPLYAFGFIASRWGWKDQEYIESVLRQFREGSYPIDAFIGDFEWFTHVSDYKFGHLGRSSYHDFGYNKVTFPDPVNQFKQYLNDYHVRFGGIRKPRLGNTDLIKEAVANDWILPDGEQVNSGSLYAAGRNLNYSIPEARAWYSEHQKHYLTEGVSFWWNDEGETDYFTFYWWNKAQIDSLESVDKTRRFFSINRAWSPGMARLGATVWTGDIHAVWDDLRRTPGYIVNWAIAGAPYVTCDIGGFQGNTTGELLTRWMQVGAFMPIMRVHSTITAKPHWPFLFPEQASELRQALNLRYRLIPYHYSLAHRMFETQKLLARPVFAEFPDDVATMNLSSQWFDGDLLVAPVLREDSIKEVYLPRGSWFVFNTDRMITGPKNITGDASLDEIPVFVRPGAVIPLAPVVQHTGALPGGPLEVQLYAGADGNFTMVEDDGLTKDYEAGVAVRRIDFKFTNSAAGAHLHWEVSGNSSSPHLFRQLQVKVFNEGRIDVSPVVPIDGQNHIDISTATIVRQLRTAMYSPSFFV